MIVTGFSNCLDIDSAATFTAAGTPQALTGVLTFENTIFNCGTNFVEGDEGGEPWTTQAFIDAQAGNAEADPNLDGVYPPANAAYLSGATIDTEKFGEYIDKVDFIGAVRGPNETWHYNWSIFVD